MLTYPKYLDEYEQKNISTKENVKFITNSFIHAFRNKALLNSLINSSIYSGYYKAMKDFIQPYLKSLAVALPVLLYLSNEEKIGLFLGLTYFVIFLTNSILSLYSSKIESLFNSQSSFLNISLAFGAFIGLSSGVLMEYFNSFWAIILFIIVLSIENSRKPSGVANITDNCKDNIHAGILSVQSQLSSLFAASIMMFIGFFADLFSVGAGIILISFVILLFYPLMKVKKLN